MVAIVIALPNDLAIGFNDMILAKIVEDWTIWMRLGMDSHGILGYPDEAFRIRKKLLLRSRN
jgi:hypothetical protein